VDPVPFAVDWDMFRSDLGESLGGTALERYFDWNGGARVRGKQLEAKYRKKQKKQGDIV